MERDLEVSLELFRAEGNPVLIWEMWRHCRREGLPVPKEVEDYLDKVGNGILALTSSPPGKLAPDLQKAEDWTKRGWKISVETVGRAWRRHRLPQPKAETNGDGGSA
jgi:hypothetical protein